MGYNNALYGFDGNTCGVIVSIDEQSPDIAQGVDASEELRSGSAGEDVINAQGAGDQGMMFGYACNETPETDAVADLKRTVWPESGWPRCRSGQLPYLRPDGKTLSTRMASRSPSRVS